MSLACSLISIFARNRDIDVNVFVMGDDMVIEYWEGDKIEMDSFLDGFSCAIELMLKMKERGA